MNKVINEDTKDKFRKFASFGYGSRGFIYLAIGFLAFLDALGVGGSTENSKGALRVIFSQSYGKVLLGIIAVGLVGYAAWRAVQAVLDADGHGRDGKGIVIRIGLLVSSITHILLAIWAFTVLSGGGGGDGGTKWYNSQWAQYFYVIGGLAFIGAGAAFIKKGWEAEFKKYMALPHGWMVKLSQFGLIARGVVWIITGVFFIITFIEAGADKVKGIGDALEKIETTTYGEILLGIVAVGLFAFGIYSILEAAYRRISLENAERKIS